MLNKTVNVVIRQLAAVIRRREDLIVRRWVDAIYSDSRTELPGVLSFEQLVGPVQEMLDFLCGQFEGLLDEENIADDVRQLRAYPQVRFYQGVLIDEVARELIIFRKVLNEVLWKETAINTPEGHRVLKWALGQLNTFIDEMVIQTLVIYAANLRPPVETRASVWPPPRRQKIDFPNLR
jgi:RsbT co-antagonist protein rsbRD N-terminal domain